MEIESTQCDRSRIARFLGQTLPADEQVELELHLEHYSKCQLLLSDGTAEPEWWNDASDFLTDEPFDLRRLSETSIADDESAWEAKAADDVTSPNTARVIELLAPTDDPRMLGRIGPYEVAGVIGAGGMGVVMKGFDRALDRYAAVKVLAPHLAGLGAARRRFSREAKAVAAVVHENVIETYGVSEANGLPYLAMAYICGTSLQKRIVEHGPLTLLEILRIASQTAAGLAAAHAQGLVHRDIKPANILLAEGTERVKITDFGLARAADDASLTHTGVVAGTPQFMSPEQARGDSVDSRSDLFSLGSLMYTMCAGRPPVRADSSYGILRKITDTQPRSIREVNSEIPEWLVAIIKNLHEKEPNKRFQLASEVAELLEQCLAHVQQPTTVSLPTSIASITSTASSRNRVRSHAAIWIGSIVAITLVVTAIINGLSSPIDDETTTEPGSVVESTSGEKKSSDEALTQPAVWDDEITEQLRGLKDDSDSLESRSQQTWDESASALIERIGLPGQETSDQEIMP